MSSFVVSSKIMNLCVAAMLEEQEDPTKLGRALYAMNERAAGESLRILSPRRTYTYSRPGPQDDLRTLKALSCLVYQCTEEQIPSEELYKRLDRAKLERAMYIVQRLPAYEAIEWG